MRSKRLFDIIVSLVLLILVLPILALIMLLVLIFDGAPVFFRQIRVGRNQVPFTILKFRTMKNESDKSLRITAENDVRITMLGKILRKTKLDELPQLINVIKGDMSLVGPRPEVPEYVAFYPEIYKEKIFSIRPGITDWATISYRNEESLLASSPDPVETYRNEILPKKLDYYINYVDKRSIYMDILILFKTVKAILFKK